VGACVVSGVRSDQCRNAVCYLTLHILNCEFHNYSLKYPLISRQDQSRNVQVFQRFFLTTPESSLFEFSRTNYLFRSLYLLNFGIMLHLLLTINRIIHIYGLRKLM
jgi:hypothetical protein